MKEKTKCLVCKKRYAIADDWKTEREKVICMTCHCMEQMVEAVRVAVISKADEVGLDVSWDVQFAPKQK